MTNRFILLIAVLWPLVLHAASGASTERVAIFVDVPAELKHYSGTQPVTLGIPFAAGRLYASHGMRVVDHLGHAQLAQFQITSEWRPGEVRWLLVDLLVPIKQGKAPQYFLEFGPNVSRSTVGSSLKVSRQNADIVISTGAMEFRVGRNNDSLGSFELKGVAPRGDVGFVARVDQMAVELEGPVRAVVRVSGRYETADGTSVAEFVTRARFYAGLPFVRLYHTLIWTADDKTRISVLRFVPKEVLSGANVQTSVDGLKLPPAVSHDLKQVDWNEARDGSGKRIGKHWDGWAELQGANSSLFAALRWPWQQYPVGFAAGGGGLSLGLMAPLKPMSLSANEVVIPPLRNYKDNYYNLATDKGPYGPLSPRGVAKTYELLLWYAHRDTTDYTLDPAVKNTLLQRPIIAYADPRFVASAQLPSPLSAYNPQEFPVIERAIENAFDWYTRERPEDYDYGVWNFGDLQYDWHPTTVNNPLLHGHYSKYRYWLNNGKSWSLTPWLLWMRSGNRKYFEKGEAHARHVMDVDTCHVTYLPELKFRGGTSPYNLLHFGAHTYPAYYSNDSEYLPYYYFLTGYERARDVMNERVEGLLAVYPDKVLLPDIEDLITGLSQDYTFSPSGPVASKELRLNREHYHVLGELALLYEYTHEPRLKTYAEQLLSFLLPAQASNGWLPGLKTSNWFSHSLNLAQRAFPQHRTAIRELLRRWQEHVGTYWQPGNTGRVDGPVSLWDLLTLQEHTGNSMYLHAAAAIARTQALGFYEEPNEWRGFGAPPAHEMGPIIRDWVSVMGRLSQLPSNNRPTGLAPATFFNSGLPTKYAPPPPKMSPGCPLPPRFPARHVLFVLDEHDEAIRVHLDINAANVGLYRIQSRIRVIAPDGAETSTEPVIEIEPTELATQQCYGLSSPLTPEKVAGYRKAITIAIPRDGKKGAYAIEFFSSAARELPVFARSSTGKLVHYFPLYAERARHVAPHALYSDYRTQLPSVSSHTYGGEVWFKPQPNLSPITLVYATTVMHGSPSSPSLPKETVAPNHPLARQILTRDHLAWPSIRVFGADRKQACSTQIVGTTNVVGDPSLGGIGNPLGKPCQFVPVSTALHSFVTQNRSSHYKIFMEGIEPFVSSTPEEWFDPRQHPSPDLQQFLVPRD